jgi:DNA-binding NarL/FixJ family response regulator
MVKNIQLTSREMQVLALLAKGNTDLIIASQLSIELATVKAHNKNIYRKLNVRNRSEAVLFWINN